MTEEGITFGELVVEEYNNECVPFNDRISSSNDTSPVQPFGEPMVMGVVDVPSDVILENSINLILENKGIEALDRPAIEVESAPTSQTPVPEFLYIHSQSGGGGGVISIESEEVLAAMNTNKLPNGQQVYVRSRKRLYFLSDKLLSGVGIKLGDFRWIRLPLGTDFTGFLLKDEAIALIENTDAYYRVKWASLTMTVDNLKSEFGNETTYLNGRYELNRSLFEQTANAISMEVESTKTYLGGRITEQEAQLLIQAGQILLRASLSDLDPLKNRIYSAESSIMLQATEIALRVKESDFNQLTGRVTSSESIILQHATDILLRAKQTDMDAASSRISQAEILIDGANAAIGLKADQSVVTALESTVSQALISIDGAKADILLRATKEEVNAMGTRVSSAEIDINGAKADILLRATKEEVTALGTRMTSAQVDIDGAKAQISLLATKEEVTALGSKYTTAQLAIDGANAAIQLCATKIEVSALGTQISAAQIAIDGANANILLAATKVEVNALGTRLSNAEINIDGAASKIELAAARIDINTLNNSYSAARIDIDGLKGDITLKAEKSVTDNLTGRVSTAEGMLTVQAGLISSKVAASDFNDLTGRVTTAESNITQSASKISLLINSDDTIVAGVIVDAINSGTVLIQGDRLQIDSRITTLGNFAVSNSLVGSGKDANGVLNGSHITIDPDRSEIIFDTNGVRGIRITTDSLTPLALLQNNGGSYYYASGTTVNAGNAILASCNDVNSSIGNSRTVYVGSRSGTAAIESAIAPEMKWTLSTGGYSINVPYILNLVHNGKTADGRWQRITGNATANLTINLCSAAGVVSTITETIPMSVDSGDKGISYQWAKMARFNLQVASSTAYWVSISCTITNNTYGIRYQTYNHATTFSHSYWSEQYNEDVRYEVTLGNGMSVDGSIGITELTKTGFQSVWSSTRYLRLDGSGTNPIFLETQGRWLHNGVEVNFTTAGITAMIDPALFASKNYVDTGFYNRTQSDSHYLGIASQAADSAKLGGVVANDYIRYSANNGISYNNFAIGQSGGRNFIQSYNSQPLDLNPLGNAVTISSNIAYHAGNINRNDTDFTASRVFTADFRSSTHFKFLHTNNGEAQYINTAGILASDSYADATKIPALGGWFKGNLLANNGNQVWDASNTPNPFFENTGPLVNNVDFSTIYGNRSYFNAVGNGTGNTNSPDSYGTLVSFGGDYFGGKLHFPPGVEGYAGLKWMPKNQNNSVSWHTIYDTHNLNHRNTDFTAKDLLLGNYTTNGIYMNNGYSIHSVVSRNDGYLLLGRYGTRNDFYIDSNGDSTFAGAAIVNGIARFADYAQSNTFTGAGFTATGWGISTDGDANFRNHIVRGKLTTYEFVQNKISIANGNMIVSDNAKLKTWMYVGDGSFYYVFDEVAPFNVGDTLMCKTDGKLYTVLINWRSGDGKTFTTYTNENYNITKGVAAGDLLVRWNSTDAARKGLLYLCSSDTGSPNYQVIYDGIVKAQFGNLEGRAWNGGTLPANTWGMWAENAYLSGAVNATSGKIGAWIIGETYMRSVSDRVYMDNQNNSIFVVKPNNGGHVMLGQTFVNGAWTGKYGFSATDSSNRELFRMDDEVCRFAGGAISFTATDVTFADSVKMQWRADTSKNLMGTSKWKIGASVTNIFDAGSSTPNGNTNTYVYGGLDASRNAVCLFGTGDNASGSNAGWNASIPNMDSQYTYRYSVWVYTTATTSNIYHGCDGNGYVCSLGGTMDTNPYSIVTACDSIKNSWKLLTFCVHAKGYTGATKAETGVYNTDGTKIAGGTDWKWYVDSRSFSANWRTYLYYASNGAVYFYSPELYRCDGSEPNIQQVIDTFAGRNRLTQLTATGMYTGTIDCNMLTGNLIKGKTFAAIDASNNMLLQIDGSKGVLESYKSNKVAMKLDGGSLTFYEQSGVPALFIQNAPVLITDFFSIGTALTIPAVGNVPANSSAGSNEFTISAAGLGNYDMSIYFDTITGSASFLNIPNDLGHGEGVSISYESSIFIKVEAVIERKTATGYEWFANLGSLYLSNNSSSYTVSINKNGSIIRGMAKFTVADIYRIKISTLCEESCMVTEESSEFGTTTYQNSLISSSYSIRNDGTISGYYSKNGLHIGTNGLISFNKTSDTTRYFAVNTSGTTYYDNVIQSVGNVNMESNPYAITMNSVDGIKVGGLSQYIKLDGNGFSLKGLNYVALNSGGTDSNRFRLYVDGNGIVCKSATSAW